MRYSVGLLTVVLFVVVFAVCSFATEKPVLTFSYEFAQKGEVQPSRWRLAIEFSHPVSNLEFARNVFLMIDGQDKSYNILSAIDASGIVSRLPLPSERTIYVIEPKEAVATGNVDIILKKGLKMASGQGSLLEEGRISFRISNFAEIVEVTPFYDSPNDRGVQFWIGAVIKNEQKPQYHYYSLPEEDLKNLIQIIPSVGKVSIHCERRQQGALYKVTGNFVKGKKYRLFTRGGEMKDSGIILAPADITFVAVGAPPEISFDPTKSVLELRSRQALPVTLVNIYALRCQLTDIPPFLIPNFADLSMFVAKDGITSKDAGVSGSENGNCSAADAEQRLLEVIKVVDSASRLISQASKLGVNLTPFLVETKPKSEVFINEGSPDKPSKISIPLTFREKPEHGGAVLVSFYDPEGNNIANSVRLVQITDLAITYRFSEKSLLVWTTSLETGKPTPNVELMAVDKNNRRLFLGKTDSNGVLCVHHGNVVPVISVDVPKCVLATMSLNIEDIKILVAATGNDACFTPLEKNRLVPANLVQVRNKEVKLDTINGHVFTERGIYKPGEIVYWKAAFRKYENHTIKPFLDRVIVEIKDSKDELVFEEECLLNEFGTCSGSLELSPNAPLGFYKINIFNRNSKQSDNKVQITSCEFQVQKFERPRHFVEIKVETKSRENKTIVGRPKNESYLEFLVCGKYYTGGTVKNAKVRWTAHLVPSNPNLGSEFENYCFGGGKDKKELIESGEALLDSEGKIAIPIPIDKSLNSGLYAIEFSATVLDVDGKPATTVQTYQPKQKYLVGMNKVNVKISQGDQLVLGVIVLDANNRKLDNGVIKLNVFKKREFYTRKRDEDGNIYYRWESSWLKTISGEQIIKNGIAIFELAFDDYGEFMLQAVYRSQEGEHLCQQVIDIGYNEAYYDTESSDGDNVRRGLNKNEILIMQSKSEGSVGDKIKFDFMLPRPATHALVTVERDKIYEYFVVPVKDRFGSAEVTLKADFRPNVFIGVTVPVARDGFPVYKTKVDLGFPNVYYGYAQVKVRNSVNSLKIAIQANEPNLIVHPGASKKLDFVVTYSDGKPAKNCEMAVCVVDEAVLALTGYVTPVLNSLANFVLPLSVFSGDLRLSLITQELVKLIHTQGLTGGGAGTGEIVSDLALRKDFRPVAYWNPALITDKNGRVTIEVCMPDTMTAYRIYAVCLDTKDAFGSAERRMMVTKEFFIQPGLPRFLVVGDKAVVPLSLVNKTKISGGAKIQIEEAKNLMVAIKNPTPTMNPETNTVIKADLEADNGAGEGDIIFAGKFETWGDRVKESINIYPKNLIINRSLIGNFRNIATISVNLPDEVAKLPNIDLKGSLSARVVLSLTQWAKIAPALQYLLKYPYGCVEQTSSGIIPLAALRKLITEGVIPGIDITKVDGYLKPGISRLLSMQHDGGGFSYWPGGTESSWWGSIYATFALALSKEAGYDVPEDKFEAALSYISKNIIEENGKDSYPDYGIKELAAVSLALNKKLKREHLEELLKNYNSLTTEGKAYLCWADSIVGVTPNNVLKQRVLELEPKFETERRHWYDSSAREAAAILIASLHVDPKSSRNLDIVGQLLRQIDSEGRWSSTADTGICLFAIAEYFKIQPLPNEKQELFVKVFQSGKNPIEVKLDKKAEEIELDPKMLLKDKTVVLQSSGDSLPISYSIIYSYPDTASAPEELDKGFWVEKRITNLGGSQEIRVGDILKITVEFEDDLSRERKYGEYEYLVVEDALPAGFVAINTALKTEQKPVADDDTAGNSNDEESLEWEEGAYKFAPDHLEFHDEKVLAFKNYLCANKYRFTYYVRAACEGEFFMRPTRVSLMYNPDKYGITRGERITILPAK